MAKKHIGIVDYQLDNFHARVYLAAVRGPLAARGYEIVGATAWDELSSRSWATDNGVEYFASVAELAAKVDHFMVLAPSNPELHLEMCEEVFRFGKPTFVDKTFAPNLEVARKIFALADTFNVPVQTSSALRSSVVQEEMDKISEPLRSMFITAAGPTFSEYGIHPLELAVSCLGSEVSAVMHLGPNDHPQVILQFLGKRTAIIDFNSRAEIPFAATLITDSCVKHLEVDTDRLFVDAAASILDFFDAAEAQFNRAESLIIRQLLDVLDRELPPCQFISLTVESDERQPVQGPHWKHSAGKLVAQSQVTFGKTN